MTLSPIQNSLRVRCLNTLVLLLPIRVILQMLYEFAIREGGGMVDI